jgi:hypothetical protein
VTAPFPLVWPESLPRSKNREKGQFKTTLAGALGNVEEALRLFGRDSDMAVSEISLSSNVSLGRNNPDDPGVAVWFKWDGEQRCIAVDRYTTPAANLQAIYHVLEARRTELRHGTLALVRATFQGLKALPAPPGEHWTEVLELAANATLKSIEDAYRFKAAEAHPDRGGSNDGMARLNRARDQAKKERG